MISHVVLIRLQEGLSSRQVDDFVATAKRVLAPIPGVQNLHVGRSLGEASYPLALVMDFDSEEALEAYQVHAQHQRFLSDVIGPIIADKQVLDYRYE